jgi:uncharacterized protein (TIGR03085 family)
VVSICISGGEEGIGPRYRRGSVTSDLDQRERAELADLLDELGPDQPTLCEGWTTSAMAAHLVVRERQPLAGPGILLGGPLATLTERLMNRELERHGFAGTVQRVRTGPPLPLRFEPIRYRMNLIEMTVHHEDVRRANDRPPRADRPDLDDAVWEMLGGTLKLLALRGRIRGLRVELHRPDGALHASGPEDGPKVVLTGPPVELLLHLQGREAASQATVSGDEAAVAKFLAADLSL